MPIEPMTAIALTQTIAGFFGKLVGALPRGDHQKFRRTIYPHMVAQAQKTGVPVYAFWFGSAPRVSPGGEWGVVGNFSSIAEFREWLKTEAEREGRIYTIECGAQVDWNSDSSILSGCSFKLHTGSLFGRVKDTIGDFLPGGFFDKGSVDLGDAQVQKAGFGGDTAIFALVAVVALFFVLPKLGKA